MKNYYTERPPFLPIIRKDKWNLIILPDDMVTASSPTLEKAEKAKKAAETAPEQEVVSTSSDVLENLKTRSLPKWQIVGSSSNISGAGSRSRPRASLQPGSAPQKATLLTENGPIDVRIRSFSILIFCKPGTGSKSGHQNLDRNCRIENPAFSCQKRIVHSYKRTGYFYLFLFMARSGSLIKVDLIY